MMTKITADERLIVALDLPDRAAALRLAEQLSGLVNTFKIGYELFTAEGPGPIREIIDSGARVFLDLKYHDIPNTVGGAVSSAGRLGVSIMNVHGTGGIEMLRAAAKSAAAATCSKGVVMRSGSVLTRPAVIAVTVVTSMDQATLNSVGIPGTVEDHVIRIAKLAREAGLDGVVASPREVRLIREAVGSDDFLIVTPGIRPEWAAAGDQRRIATPSDALRNGADYLVIGRPITGNPDPRAAVQRVLDEIG